LLSYTTRGPLNASSALAHWESAIVDSERDATRTRFMPLALSVDDSHDRFAVADARTQTFHAVSTQIVANDAASSDFSSLR
jgi:hypothetical protein